MCDLPNATPKWEKHEKRGSRRSDSMNRRIHDAAKNGDAIAIRAFEHTGRMLGFKLADVVAHTNPEAIFLFGGLALAKDLIFEPTKRYMEQNLLSIYKGKVKLLESELSTQNAAVLGASSLVWSIKERK
jgi:glucokinase